MCTECFACLDVCMCNTCVPDTLRSRVSDLWHWSYRGLCRVMACVLGSKPRCSVRAVTTLNHRDISPALSFSECSAVFSEDLRKERKFCFANLI